MNRSRKSARRIRTQIKDRVVENDMNGYFSAVVFFLLSRWRKMDDFLIIIVEHIGWIFFSLSRQCVYVIERLLLGATKTKYIAANGLSFRGYSQLNWGEFPQLNILKF